MKITIITVVFENKQFIRDALESVLSQDYPDIEYIVIDGGSKDGSLEIIRAYQDRISKTVSEPDQGIYDAMNKGIGMATGDVIGFLNSDDFYVNDQVVSKIAAAFAKDIDAVYADLDYVSIGNKEKIIRKWRSGAYHPKRFLYGWMPPHPTFFVRREAYRKLGAYNTLLRSSADYELMLRMILRHGIRLKYIPEVLVKMRVGGQSNRSFLNRVKAHLEDWKVWKLNGLRPKFYTLLLKPFQKIFQFRF